MTEGATEQFALTPRYWQNRLGRSEVCYRPNDADFNWEPPEGVPDPGFEATVTMKTRHRVVIELDQDEARMVIDDVDALLPTLVEEPGLETSALEAKAAILERWPHLAA